MLYLQYLYVHLKYSKKTEDGQLSHTTYHQRCFEAPQPACSSLLPSTSIARWDKCTGAHILLWVADELEQTKQMIRVQERQGPNVQCVIR